MFRKAWGETVVGGTTLGAAAFCAWMTLVVVVGLLAWAFGAVALAVFAIGAIVLMVFFSALQGIYVASLYRYATEGQVPPGLDPALLDRAFIQKPRR